MNPHAQEFEVLSLEFVRFVLIEDEANRAAINLSCGSNAE